MKWNPPLIRPINRLILTCPSTFSELRLQGVNSLPVLLPASNHLVLMFGGLGKLVGCVDKMQPPRDTVCVSAYVTFWSLCPLLAPNWETEDSGSVQSRVRCDESAI